MRSSELPRFSDNGRFLWVDIQSGNAIIFDLSKAFDSFGTKRMTWLREYLSHAVSFDDAIAGIFQLLQRLRIEVCLCIVEKIFFNRLWNSPFAY